MKLAVRNRPTRYSVNNLVTVMPFLVGDLLKGHIPSLLFFAFNW